MKLFFSVIFKFLNFSFALLNLDNFHGEFVENTNFYSKLFLYIKFENLIMHINFDKLSKKFMMLNKEIFCERINFNNPIAHFEFKLMNKSEATMKLIKIEPCCG